ncbi:hypothetical protein IW142_003558 [Coemansia sp. RSA 564]|nr:hypothetical protein IW142_003558 [Coemansia sp. RSA 564]
MSMWPARSGFAMRTMASNAAAACGLRRSIHVSLTAFDQSPSPSSNPTFSYFSKRDAKFLLSAVAPEHYSHLALPEITFAGRSNVGKSSLISAVLRSKGLVKTSNKPGHTSALNFFSLTSQAAPGAITVVDMPGYGFRSRNEWGEFIMTYLSTRKE